jgi:adenylate cyclase, class 2
LALNQLGAVEGPTHQHVDQYFNHPCRDFAQTQEAFRLRRVDGIPLVTYKGPKLPGTVKARQELEWRLDPGDADGSKFEELLALLSFRPVAVVEKSRRCFSLPHSLDMSVVIDEVRGLGSFTEIELVLSSEAEIELARSRITELGGQLGLLQPESRSYLRMLLESRAK